MAIPPKTTDSPVDARSICVVPYRLNEGSLEFCLVSGHRNNSWEFPVREVPADSSTEEGVVSTALSVFGLEGKHLSDEPLDQIPITGSGGRHASVFLLEAVDEVERWGEYLNFRRRWCRAEEARHRIRRKPARRLIDLAVRHVTRRIDESHE